MKKYIFSILFMTILSSVNIYGSSTAEIICNKLDMLLKGGLITLGVGGSYILGEYLQANANEIANNRVDSIAKQMNAKPFDVPSPEAMSIRENPASAKQELSNVLQDIAPVLTYVVPLCSSFLLLVWEIRERQKNART